MSQHIDVRPSMTEVNALNGKIIAGSFTETSLANVKTRLIAINASIDNGGICGFALHTNYTTGDNTLPYNRLFTGRLTRFNISYFNVVLVDAYNNDYEITYLNGDWTFGSLNSKIEFNQTISNLNDTSLVGGNYYYTADATGNPSTTAGRLIQIKSSASSWGGQIAVPNSSSFLFYARMKTSSGYGDWEELAVNSKTPKCIQLLWGTSLSFELDYTNHRFAMGFLANTNGAFVAIWHYDATHIDVQGLASNYTCILESDNKTITIKRTDNGNFGGMFVVS